MAGRDILDTDRKGAPGIGVVNQAFVRRFLNGASPLGHTITIGIFGPDKQSLEIVGVAADAVYRSLRDPAPPTLYMPLAQWSDAPMFLATVSLSIRTATGAPVSLIRSVAAAIGNVNPRLALTFRPLADQVNASLSQERVVALLSGFFGALALLLAGLGIYGVTAYAVSRRGTEIGIRMALGAAPGGVVRLVMMRVMLLVGLGEIVGIGASLWAGRFVSTLLFGLRPRDPITLLGAVSLLALSGAFAGWLPAWRASRTDPAEVLRET